MITIIKFTKKISKYNCHGPSGHIDKTTKAKIKASSTSCIPWIRLNRKSLKALDHFQDSSRRQVPLIQVKSFDLFQLSLPSQ